MSPRSRRSLAVAALAVAALASCRPDPGVDDIGSETTPPIFDPPPAECGNGYVEADEECDDGNLDDGDGCDATCKIPCGLLWETSVFAAPDDTAPLLADMRVGPEGEIVLYGTFDAQIPELDDSLWIGVLEPDGSPRWSTILGSEDGDDQLAAGLALGPAGELYLSATVPGVANGDDTDIWIARLDSAGDEEWSVVFDGPEFELSADVAGGVGLSPNGELIVSGHQRITSTDSDIWFASLSPSDGAESWSRTWTGQTAENGYSLDRGGLLEVGPNGAIWIMGVEYVDYQTFDGRLFLYDSSGTFIASWAPHADESPGHEHLPAGLSVDDDGRVYFGFVRTGPGSTYWAHALTTNGEIGWTRERDSFVDEGDADTWELGDVAVANGEVFVGGWLERFDQGETWYEGWVHRLDKDGAPICARRHTATGATAVHPYLWIDRLAAAADGELVLAAGRLSDIESARSFWVGAFRGPS